MAVRIWGPVEKPTEETEWQSEKQAVIQKYSVTERKAETSRRRK